ncbi:LysR family transcriptional regulator [Kutzneria chonburiensis]|uniref:LysR family transcriptional regulator n=1 Tax=Kutzneria chonburiensis TaxID=1483604 RepID=A0ABV6N6L4_9PSEU|nr:LysR family transcriptional regulator [Kutzneria chonburiensis]
MLNPWRLRLLSRLDTLGTIRAVAQDANLSASSVSQQLAVLETETRTQLLERTGRRVRLTPAGLVLARRARAILDHMDTVEAELRGLREEPAGLVRLGAFQSAIHSLAVPAVARYPQLDVELLELEPHESIPALRGGDVDVIVTTTDFGQLPLGPDLEIVPLATDPIVLVSSPDRHVPRGPAVLSAYAGEPWALDIAQSYMADLTLRLCRESGFEPRVVSRFSNYLMTLRHVEAGLAVALLPGLAVDPRYRVVTRELAVPLTRTIAAVVRRGSPLRAAVNLVLTALREQPLWTDVSS